MAFLKDFASGFFTGAGDYLAEEEKLKRSGDDDLSEEEKLNRLLALIGKGTPDEDATTGTPPEGRVFRRNIDKGLGGMFGGPSMQRKGFVASENPALDVANAGNVGNMKSMDLEELIKLIMSVGK